jgi:hypothetical protein
VVHHDEFFEHASDLPTFNSFAITANLHRIKGLSRRFIYVEDDYLFGRPTQLHDFEDADGKLLLRPKWERSNPASEVHRADASPWQLALAQSNALLDERYGPQPRWLLKHAPTLIDRDLRYEMDRLWPDVLRRTSASRFRAKGNVFSEHLYCYFLLHEGRARLTSFARSYADAHYQGVDNIIPQQVLQFAFLRLQRPRFVCLNDNFDANPSRTVVRLTRGYLSDTYPTPSRFERS